mmetsp:Transcript_8556/g.25336  ORF Transcript_8556/g.25336 Transcript_8556/m.25336 type:complete len:355 (+) Transcript_8556:51-1115(+)
MVLLESLIVAFIRIESGRWPVGHVAQCTTVHDVLLQVRPLRADLHLQVVFAPKVERLAPRALEVSDAGAPKVGRKLDAGVCRKSGQAFTPQKGTRETGCLDATSGFPEAASPGSGSNRCHDGNPLSESLGNGGQGKTLAATVAGGGGFGFFFLFFFLLFVAVVAADDFASIDGDHNRHGIFSEELGQFFDESFGVFFLPGRCRRVLDNDFGNGLQSTVQGIFANFQPRSIAIDVVERGNFGTPVHRYQDPGNTGFGNLCHVYIFCFQWHTSITTSITTTSIFGAAIHEGDGSGKVSSRLLLLLAERAKRTQRIGGNKGNVSLCSVSDVGGKLGDGRGLQQDGGGIPRFGDKDFR